MKTAVGGLVDVHADRINLAVGLIFYRFTHHEGIAEAIEYHRRIGHSPRGILTAFTGHVGPFRQGWQRGVLPAPPAVKRHADPDREAVGLGIAEFLRGGNQVAPVKRIGGND
jgi:hypothetical protein